MINLQHLYLDENDASSKVIFQDQNSQIVGIKFKKNDLNFLEKYDITKNCCIYFLCDEESIYIGKSVNGIDRIKTHVNSKDFWSFGLMFVTDNKSWTSTTIDYLEHHFINTFKNLPELSLENIEHRNNIPNITIYDKATIESAILKVEFYLNCHNINTKKTETKKYNKIYYNAKKNASLTYDAGKFILLKGSQLVLPLETTKESDLNVYNRLVKDMQNYLEEEIIDANLVLMEDIVLNSPSRAANLCVGRSENGWTYFQNLNEIRT
jgi:hypothetical protein